jgi:hypothetical protein
LLQRIETAKQEKLLEFLRAIPYLRQFPSKVINKL